MFHSVILWGNKYVITLPIDFDTVARIHNFVSAFLLSVPMLHKCMIYGKFYSHLSKDEYTYCYRLVYLCSKLQTPDMLQLQIHHTVHNQGCMCMSHLTPLLFHLIDV